MRLVEEKRDLFTVNYPYYLAHCINAEYVLGRGIAKEFEDKYEMSNCLKLLYPTHGDLDKYLGKALLTATIFNLVTKKRHYSKPDYETLASALNDMRKQIKEIGVIHLAMPKIGCGLDRLDWNIVKEMIIDTFKDDDIDILICHID